jgi:hypothetical protein
MDVEGIAMLGLCAASRAPIDPCAWMRLFRFEWYRGASHRINQWLCGLAVAWVQWGSAWALPVDSVLKTDGILDAGSRLRRYKAVYERYA